MAVAAFDHAAIPIADVDAMLRFYGALGCEVHEVLPPLFYSVAFGDNKINFHGPGTWCSSEFTLRGPSAKPGCGDFCFVWDGTAGQLAEMLARLDVPIVEGPVARVGGRGLTGQSTYIRDPDGNLLEFIVYPA
ncbi:MAG: hypothetical protein F4029_20630 [Gammaproteobacteria bacterium]|nr:hypothetical protein [Gammaproteobacteria bacterium]MXY56524.1 hypothetical protein [Gammaproteobacteria bacterium]MYF27423.1 hypothetical protein [Gammaproteobacteria bacterium]MYK48621.1 hypothetical protein [Gammaproteobacteria bacterium]